MSMPSIKSLSLFFLLLFLPRERLVASPSIVLLCVAGDGIIYTRSGGLAGFTDVKITDFFVGLRVCIVYMSKSLSRDFRSESYNLYLLAVVAIFNCHQVGCFFML